MESEKKERKRFMEILSITEMLCVQCRYIYFTYRMDEFEFGGLFIQ